ncbi:hypothetical protein [Streptomyces sp. NPDC058385]|uniref:hypothetical protein n=1 Tax=Streptomyces sp. NPDC058385 TaxID=3346473 RepID=UPI0036693898
MIGGSNKDPLKFVTMHSYANSPVMRQVELQVRNAVRDNDEIPVLPWGSRPRPACARRRSTRAAIGSPAAGARPGSAAGHRAARIPCRTV